MRSVSLTRLAAALAVTLGCAAGNADAAVIAFTDRAAFLAATTSSGTDLFANVTPADPISGALAGPLSRTAGAYSYQASVLDDGSGSTNFYPIADANGAALTSEYATSSLKFSGFSGAVNAIGGVFYGTDFFGQVVDSVLKFAVTDASGTYSFDLANGSPSGFFAFASDSLISSLKVGSSGGIDLFATVGELTLGEANVPEPGSVLLVGLGAVALAASRRAVRRV